MRNIGAFGSPPQSARRIAGSSQHAGAGNAGRYGAIGAQSGTAGAITLNLASPTTFCGMCWPEIDQYNGVSLNDNDTLLMRMTGAGMIALFNASKTLTAQNGTPYQRTAYPGKPGANPRQKRGKYYACTMSCATGLWFNRVVLDNSGTTGAGFEFDYLQTRSGTFQIPGSTVLLTQHQITAVPEPSVWIPAGLGLAGPRGGQSAGEAAETPRHPVPALPRAEASGPASCRRSCSAFPIGDWRRMGANATERIAATACRADDRA